jgi:hypothetical protein
MNASFVCCHVHAGPESGITNSKKKRKNVRPSGGIILYHLYVGKKLNLDKSNLPKSPFTKMTNQVRGCMAFRSNELGLLLIMA